MGLAPSSLVCSAGSSVALTLGRLLSLGRSPLPSAASVGVSGPQRCPRPCILALLLCSASLLSASILPDYPRRWIVSESQSITPPYMRYNSIARWVSVIPTARRFSPDTSSCLCSHSVLREVARQKTFPSTFLESRRSRTSVGFPFLRAFTYGVFLVLGLCNFVHSKFPLRRPLLLLRFSCSLALMRRLLPPPFLCVLLHTISLSARPERDLFSMSRTNGRRRKNTSSFAIN